MLRIALVLAILIATATSVLAAPAAEAEATAVAQPAHRDSLTLQGGMLPGFTALGLEYTHVVSEHFELAGSASVGMLFLVTSVNAAVIPRVRVQSGRWSLAAGVGPGVMRLSDGADESEVIGELVADAVISYAPRENLVLQLRGGAAGYLDSDLHDMETHADVAPFIGAGLGFRF